MPQIPEYTLIRAHRSSISLQITSSGEIIVKAPYLIPSFLINNFLMDKYDWIQKRLQHGHAHTKRKHQYLDGEEFMYLGNIVKLRFGNFREISVTDTLNFPQFLSFRVKKELENWYMTQAKKLIQNRVVYHAKLMGTTYKKIFFSDTSSKWGSCSPDNTLQFNWRLIMAPILVIDYVVVHELVHTWEKNHGNEFWRLVAQYKPAYKQYRKWLNEHSGRLSI